MATAVDGPYTGVIVWMAVMIARTGACTASELEARICQWKAEKHKEEEGNGSVVAGLHSEEPSDDSEDSEEERVSSIGDSHGVSPSRSRVFATALTYAYHTAVLLIFFRFVKPTNALLLEPLKRKIIKYIKEYRREVETAQADVGIGGGIVWPFKILEIVGLEGELRREVRFLWKFVKGAGWRDYEATVHHRDTSTR